MIIGQHIIWSPGVSLAEIEKQVILRAMSHYKQRITVANALGICLKTLNTRLAEYKEQEQVHIERDKKREQDRNDFLRRQRGLPPSIGTGAPSGIQLGNQFDARNGSGDCEPNGSKLDARSGVGQSGNGEKDASGVSEVHGAKSVTDDSAKPLVSVSERQEVQSVLPKQAPLASSQKGRGVVSRSDEKT